MSDTTPDLSDQYNTQLSVAQERQFLNWARANGKLKDLYDYDLRGAWAGGHARGDGHMPDTYKKPNHPTFSNESKYSTEDVPGGEWLKNGDKWIFKASPTNVSVHGAEGLQKYFEEVEPGNTLVMPEIAQ